MCENRDKTNRIIGRYFSSDATSAEKNELVKLMRQGKVDYKSMVLLDSMFRKKAHTKIDGSISDNKKILWQQLNRKNKIFDRVNFVSAFQRVAAILLFPLILSFLALVYFKPQLITPNTAYAEIKCPLGVRTSFELPDGTIGYLNSGSSIKYPINFKKNRNVSVTGEVFLDVHHNVKHPFIVHTAHLDVKVLGTRFNVISYSDDDLEEIILEKGSIEVLNSIGKSLSVLTPGEKLTYHKLKKVYSKSYVEAKQYSSWIEGKLVFRNENMQQVALRLGRWYNVDIDIQDSELLNYNYRATFVDESLVEVLKLLALTAPITFEEEKREKIGNIYGKRRIIINLDRQRQ
uniref:FecR family protein n=1 Tax=uncultured Draconibacterium sp. TaxID=1573823 RepID=UPI00321694B4